MTNQYCPAKVHSISDEDYGSGRMSRDDIIKRKFGAVYENDVKSAIYRITYLLNNGVWLNSSVDLYEEIYGAKFETKEDRDLFKHPFCMQLYFNKSSKQMKAHIEYRKSATKQWNLENGGFGLIIKAQDNMFKAIGKSYESEIFLHESCIYAQVSHKPRTMGYKVIQIYDGFFTDKELDKETFDNIVKEQALRYYHKYIDNHNHNHNHKHNNKHISYINSGHIRDNSDISEEDIQDNVQEKTENSEKSRISLQKLIDSQIISKRDAAWLYMKIYNEEFTFKESRTGWSVEDRLAAREQRAYVMRTLLTKYAGRFTRKEALDFVG